MTTKSRLVRASVAAFLSLALIAPLSLSGPFGAPGASAAYVYVKVSSLGPATPSNWIKLDRLGISLAIKPGNLDLTVNQISSRYAYHYPGTSWPGGGSNTYLYGHARVGAFLKLKYARKGDIVIVRLNNLKWVKYKVTGLYNVAWNAGIWVFPTSYERLTLQTCLGAGPTARKLMVTAVPAY